MIEECRNCMHHRYQYNDGSGIRQVVAFPINMDIDFEGELCRKYQMLNMEAEPCHSFTHWKESANRSSAKRKKKKKKAVNAQHTQEQSKKQEEAKN